MKTFTCDTCSTKKVPASEMHLGWKICAACRAAKSARVQAEHEARVAQGLINGAAVLAAAKAAAEALSPEVKAARDAYEAVSSESIAQQSAALRASHIAGEGYDVSDDSAHCEGSDDIHYSR